MMSSESKKENFWSHTAILYKSFYFVFYAGYIPFLLYVPVYFKYLGLSAIHVGLINGIRPLMQTIGAPLWGIVGDKFRLRRTVFLTSFVLMTIKTMLFLVFRPRSQTCVMTWYDKANNVVMNSTYVIEHDISKRSTAPYTVTNLIALPEGIKRDQVDQTSATQQDIVAKTASTKRFGKIKKSDQDDVRIIYTHFSGKKDKLASKNASSLVYKIAIDQSERGKIFTGILLLIIFGEAFDGAVFTLADTSCLDTLGTQNYGYYRLWGSVGWGTLAPIIAVVISFFGREICDVQVGAYFCIFYFYLGFMYLAILLGSHFDFENKRSGQVDKTVKNALLNFHYGMFLFVTFYAGFCYGFLLYFVNWFIDSLGGSALVMGTATACKSIVDVVLFFLSGIVINAIGHLNTVTVSLIAYILAFVSYSYITQPWFAVPIEVLHSGAYALVWSSSVSYLNKAAPAGSSATVQGILQGVYWGLGTGGGTIIGGYVIDSYGFVSTFRAFSVTTTIILVVFVMTQLLSQFSNLVEDDTKSVTQDETSHSLDEDALLNEDIGN